MKVLIFGASGFIGQHLVEELQSAGHSIMAVSRNKQKIDQIFKNVESIDFHNQDNLISAIKKSDAIINLAGASISKPWTKSHKEKIRKSRIDFTQSIVDLIKKSGHEPAVFMQGSAIGFYGDTGENELTENTSAGEGFLAEIVDEWERVLTQADIKSRKVLLRTGLVLGKDGGLLPVMALPLKFFVGGHFGNGRQWFPWIHIQDEVRAIHYALENKEISGAINLASPGIVRQKNFMKDLGKTLRRPSWVHVPAFVLKALLGEMAKEMLLTSQKVVPEKLLKSGFDFKHNNLPETLRDILKS